MFAVQFNAVLEVSFECLDVDFVKLNFSFVVRDELGLLLGGPGELEIALRQLSYLDFSSTQLLAPDFDGKLLFLYLDVVALVGLAQVLHSQSELAQVVGRVCDLLPHNLVINLNHSQFLLQSLCMFSLLFELKV
jgi:hypothetical protein